MVAAIFLWYHAISANVKYLKKRGNKYNSSSHVEPYAHYRIWLTNCHPILHGITTSLDTFILIYLNRSSSIFCNILSSNHGPNIIPSPYPKPDLISWCNPDPKPISLMKYIMEWLSQVQMLDHLYDYNTYHRPSKCTDVASLGFNSMACCKRTQRENLY